MKLARVLSLSLLVCATACGGTADGRPPDPLPAEFPFQEIWVGVTGPGAFDVEDPFRYAATFSASVDQENGGIYPLQYGIGYFYPTRGEARAEMASCRELEPGGDEISCEVTLELELTVAYRPEYPDEFMEDSTFSLSEGARGTALMFEGWFEIGIADAIVVAETRARGSRSSYSASLRALMGDTMQIDGVFRK